MIGHHLNIEKISGSISVQMLLRVGTAAGGHKNPECDTTHLHGFGGLKSDGSKLKKTCHTNLALKLTILLLQIAGIQNLSRR